MTFKQIFSEIYRENKRYILFILTLCIVSSLLLFGGNPVAGAEDLDPAGVSSSLGGSFGSTIAPVLSLGYFGGIDTSIVFVVLSSAALGAKAGQSFGFHFLDKLSNFTFGIFDNTYICIFLLIWFGVPLLLKCFSATVEIGVSLESMQEKANGVMLLIVMIVYMVEKSGPVNAVNASDGGVNAISFGINAFLCFLVIVAALLVYVLMRYMFMLLDIVMVPFCMFVPFLSSLMVLAKFLFMLMMFTLAVYAPWMFYIIAGLMLICACILFKTAYTAVRYFEKIYVRPLLKRIFGGYDRNIPLIFPKVPVKVAGFLKGRNIQILIPVYPLTPFMSVNKMNKWDRWWFVCENGACYLVKSFMGKKDCMQIELRNTPEQKMFINRGLLYHEFFNITGPETNLSKKFTKIPKFCHFVFSREYYHRYGEILQLTGYVDLEGYRDHLRQTVPQQWRNPAGYRPPS